LIWRGKRKYEMGGIPTETVLGKMRNKVSRRKGGLTKVKLLMAEWANVYVSRDKKTVRARVLEVIENKANRDYSRRGVITKGALLRTELGKAVVVSRPGQDGVINARLLED